ncbi:hypothetical protein DNU06_12760 [Putridiphycobacter roseus]|uniref:TraB/GumN family protein n=1 Tax=Putridiphycobacter roseus TaxID=2219161 RepID=A0A2W1NAW8_9FLAO|nr:TraB/GumN family protein [Putridiphycobacter roseus]PZE16415.1 hypothetical protein DNU06_12760 [Putridiphycobacter roseus]
MKAIIIPIFLLLFIFCSCTTKPKIKVANNDNSLLWRVSKTGFKDAYIFGTMHMIEAEYYDFTKNMKAMILNSDAVIMELDGMPNPIQAILLLKLKTGTLSDYFTPEEWSKIKQFYEKEFGLSESNFLATYENFKPFFLFQSMTQSFFEGETESYDMNIMTLANKNKIPIIGLETFQEQIGFFDSISKDEMSNIVMESLASFEKDKLEFKKLQALYAAQNISEMMPLMKEQSPEFMKFEDLFLTNRNKSWIPKLKTEFESKSCFVAVGAAHLFEKNGLLNLLTQEGFKVTPIHK